MPVQIEFVIAAELLRIGPMVDPRDLGRDRDRLARPPIMRQGSQHGIGPIPHLRRRPLDTLAKGPGNLPAIPQRTGDSGMADIELARNIHQRDAGFGGGRRHIQRFCAKIPQTVASHKCALGKACL